MSYNPQGMFNWAVNWCNRANVGYWDSFPERNQQTINGITYYDCSSFTFFACWLGGGLDVGSLGYSTNLADYHNGVVNAWTVTSMISALTYAGWNIIPITNATSNLQPGDILAKIHTHTEIFYSNNPVQTMGARNSSLPLADQVSIHTTSLSYIQGYYDYIIRPNGVVPPTPTQRRGIPLWMLLRYLP